MAHSIRSVRLSVRQGPTFAIDMVTIELELTVDRLRFGLPGTRWGLVGRLLRLSTPASTTASALSLRVTSIATSGVWWISASSSPRAATTATRLSSVVLALGRSLLLHESIRLDKFPWRRFTVWRIQGGRISSRSNSGRPLTQCRLYDLLIRAVGCLEDRMLLSWI